VQPDGVTLRAARGKARLVRTASRIDAAGRLRVAGHDLTARGAAPCGCGSPMTRAAAAMRRSSNTGRRSPAAGGWSLDQQLPAAAAKAGGQLAIQFTGYEPLRIRGEQIAKENRARRLIRFGASRESPFVRSIDGWLAPRGLLRPRLQASSRPRGLALSLPPPRPPSSAARTKTASIIAGVSLPGEGVLLARVKAAEQPRVRRLEDVARRRGRKRGRGRCNRRPADGEQAQGGVPREGAEADDDAHAGEQLELGARRTAGTCRAPAGVGLFGGRARSGTAAVIQAPRRRQGPSPARTDVGWFAKPVRWQGGEEEVARAVAGEDAAGPVGAVRGRGEAED